MGYWSAGLPIHHFHRIWLENCLQQPPFGPMRGPSWPIFVICLLRLSCGMAQHFEHDGDAAHEVSSTPPHPASHVATGMTQVATASPMFTEHRHNTTGDVQPQLPPQVEPPSFSPDTKTFALSVTVTVSCPTKDASIHYTTNGSTPGPHSLSIADGEQLVWGVLGSTTFKAMAMKEGLRDSEVVEKEYVVVARAAAPVFGGVVNDGKYVGHVDLNISTATEGAWICYTTTPTSMPDPDACEHRTANGAILSWSTIGTVVYRAIALKDGMAPSPVEELVFSVIGKVAAPVIQPSTSVFLKSATLVVTCPTPGAIIYWTADGSEPDPTAPDANALSTGDQIHHSKPGVVTFKAVAVREDMANSDVVMKKIKVMRQAAAPRFKFFSQDPFHADLPKSITFVLRANFTITTTTPNATILYTTSGSMPRRKSPLTKEMKPRSHRTWTELGLTTLRAMAVAPDMADSRVTSLTLRIIRERIVTYPMHHVKEDFWLLTEESADTGAEGAEEESAPSRNATTEVQSNNTYATEQSSRPAGTSDVASQGGDEVSGEAPKRTVYMYAAVNDTQGWEDGGNDDFDEPESPAEAIGEYNNSTSPGTTATSPASVNSTSSRNSTLVPMPHKRYRKPLSIAGYEGVQPVVSIHVVEAQFKDCAYCNTRDVRGRFVTLDNPSKHFSVLEQLGGCGSGIVLPSVSGRAYTLPPRPTYYLPAGFNSTQMNELNEWTDRQFDTVKDLGCQIVSNAGFFNTTSTDCFGHLVSQGKVIRTTTAHSATFGMRNGSYVVGYLKPEEINDIANPFQEVMSGVVWLVREGQNYVSESLEVEDMSFQETGAQFATVKSARTAIGHDSHGRLVILQIEGETWTRGVDLYEVADLLVELDVVNAINLDGGSSATMMQNHSLVSDPSWLCDQDNPKSLFRCEKAVATITCIHAAPPPIFVPVETTWANWTNITAARQQAEALAAEQAKLEELSRVCALQPHLQQQQHLFGARGVNGTMHSWAIVRDYKVGFWVILPLFLLSALLNMASCHKRSERHGSTTVHAERLMLRSTDEGPWNDTTHDNGHDARKRLGWRFKGTLYGLNASRSGKRMLSSSSAAFHRVRGGRGDDVDEGDGEGGEVEVDLDGGGVGAVSQNGDRSRAAMGASIRRLRELFAQRRGEDRLEGVREVELEVNPFLNGCKGVA